ncbi:Hypothetical protein ETA_pET460420 (plasmid) [Erwinia tasmaniensis Et1/99]|uniref:Uncharacterized protein n=2 Tax=Erwinia tasmaniensis TaxID=338565 RepID=B2VB69_ERWT9|nr:Hypothetical protein ETA_pET460420 [Erwinia tasmaniensis Et1/99]
MKFKGILIKMMVCAMTMSINGCENTSAKQANKSYGNNYPLQMDLHSMDESFQVNTSNLKVIQHVNSGESPDRAVIEIEESELLDDSVFAEKTVFTMNYKKDEWKIISRVKMQRCWPGRGHQDFSVQPCH